MFNIKILKSKNEKNRQIKPHTEGDSHLIYFFQCLYLKILAFKIIIHDFKHQRVVIGMTLKK